MPLAKEISLRMLLLTAMGWAASSAWAQEPPAGASGNTPAIYTERFRPQYHYTPPMGWMNDPNGMVFFQGEFHLFYQYNPFATDFGSIGWGHALSTDLARWQTLPVAIEPEGDDLIFTGSVVIDQGNTSGFCEPAPDSATVECLVAIYTRHRRLPDGRINQTQDLAFSNDRGRTWIKYDGNPVLDLPDESFRDPKVFWHAGTQRWIMAITLPEQRRIAIFSSPDLKAWTRQSTFGPHGASQGRWECPDLVQVPIRGRPGITRWVMKVDVAEGDVAGGGGAQYWVGTFDGVTFEPMEPEDLTNVLWLDYGKDFYCAHRFYDAPGTVDNPFWIGWMNDWLYAPDLPSFPWKGTMSLPRTLDLVEEPEGLRLAQTPVASLQRLRAERSSFSAAGVDELNAQIQARRLSLDGFEMRVTIEPGAADVVGVRLREAVPFGAQPPGEIAAALGYDFASNEVFMARPEAGNVEVAPEFAGTFRGPLEEPEGSVRLRVFVDRNSVEIFSADGRTTMTNLMFPLNPVERLEFYTEGGAAGSIEVDIWPMRSAWLPESLFPFPD